ncbi:MAG: cell wall hydrolase [Eubacterium sp.]|nr:cell wall hydrolase [Eubacterium sp.]
MENLYLKSMQRKGGVFRAAMTAVTAMVLAVNPAEELYAREAVHATEAGETPIVKADVLKSGVGANAQIQEMFVDAVNCTKEEAQFRYGLVTDSGAYEPTEEEIAEEMYYDSLEMLAICVEAEAGAEPYLGKQLVADVILNRADEAGSIEAAITAPGAFSSYADGGMARHNVPCEDTYAAVAEELQYRQYPALWYFREDRYAEWGTPWQQVGNHYFSTR